MQRFFKNGFPRVCLLIIASIAAPVLAADSVGPAGGSLDDLAQFRLAPASQDSGGGSTSDSQNWSIEGPVRMRSADPIEPGELEFKNIFRYGTSSGGGDDDIEYELEIEWGIAPNHELIFELPVEFGDGSASGNADITLGWHWRLWEEQDMLPAFAMRNFIRIPSGVDSSGVDYELRGLFTKSIVPGECRLNFNPFIKFANGHNEEDLRHFQWGLLVGLDHRFSDDWIANIAYIYRSSEEEGHRDQHDIELDVEWEMVEHHTLALGTRIGVDGDSTGDNWSIALSYIFSLDGAPVFGQ